jgi:A/G-specific adenine glycosylase
MTKRELVATFQREITKWGEQNLRVFSWRCTQDPYKILVAEVLLQHTTAGQVATVFPIFIEAFPTVDDLSKASLGRIQRIIHPLGKLHRAGNLRSIAATISRKHKGIVPDRMVDLLALPGIGRYSASVILDAAYGFNHPIVDSGINRVFSRFFKTEWSSEQARKAAGPWDFARKVVPRKSVYWFSLHLLDFAAIVCIKRNPRCHRCPLSASCPSTEYDERPPRS